MADNPATLYDLAATVLAAAEGCFTLDNGEPELPGFVYLGQPPDDCCNFIAVWIDNVYQTTDRAAFGGFPSPTPVPQRCGDQGMAATVHVMIKRDCWPAIQGNVLPQQAVMEAASEQIYTDGYRLWCCLLQAYYAGELLPWSDPASPQPTYRVVWQPMVPHTPAGGCAGWEVVFQAEVPPCGCG